MTKDEHDDQPARARGHKAHRVDLTTRSPDEAWSGVIEGLLAIDKTEVHQRLRKYLDRRCEPTAADVGRALERAGAYYAEASALAALARVDYEALKQQHDEWLEAKRTAVHMILEEEKVAHGWKKQITEKMVMDRVRVTWPEECADRFGRLHKVQAAVHALEALPKAVEIRTSSLAKVGDLVIRSNRA